MSGKDVGIIAGILAVLGLVYVFKDEIEKQIYPYGKDYIPIPYAGSVEEYRNTVKDTVNKTLDDATEVFETVVSDLTDAWKLREGLGIDDLVTNIEGQTDIEEYRDTVKDTINKIQTIVEDIPVSIPYVGSIEEYRNQVGDTINKVVEPIKEVIATPIRYLYKETYDRR